MSFPVRVLPSFMPEVTAAPPQRLLTLLVAGEVLFKGTCCSVFPETTCIRRLLTDEGGGTLFHCLDPRLRKVLDLRGMLLSALPALPAALKAWAGALLGRNGTGWASGSFWRAFWSICSNDSCCPAARMTCSSGPLGVAGLSRGASFGGVGGGGGGTVSAQDGKDGVVFI